MPKKPDDKSVRNGTGQMQKYIKTTRVPKTGKPKKPAKGSK